MEAKRPSEGDSKERQPSAISANGAAIRAPRNWLDLPAFSATSAHSRAHDKLRSWRQDGEVDAQTDRAVERQFSGERSRARSVVTGPADRRRWRQMEAQCCSATGSSPRSVPPPS